MLLLKNVRKGLVDVVQDHECLIWGSQVSSVDYANDVFFVENSPRVGGNYKLTWEAKDIIDYKEVTDDQKARLTTFLVDERRANNVWPLITTSVIKKTLSAPPLPVQERADRLLRFISESTSNRIGQRVPIFVTPDPIHLEALARSDSADRSELEYLGKYLHKNGWIDINLTYDGNVGPDAMVTVEGYRRLEEQRKSLDVSQAFIAMWFDDCMDEAFDQGIKPAIEHTGYNPLRIDQKEHVNKIDDEIIAELRRSKFVVADFTHGDDGARGGVYYEAGFAHGLDLPVIFTCREDAVEALHFDTEHYNHIVWTTPEELREKLKNRILAVIGEGPEIPSNS